MGDYHSSLLMEVMTILISMMTMMMMPEASLGCSFSYLVSIFIFRCLGNQNMYLNKMNFSKYDVSYDVDIIFRALNNYQYFVNFIKHHEE